MATRYIPPQKRTNEGFNHNIKKRREFLPGPTFNTLTEMSPRSSSTVIKTIEIPSSVDPPIVNKPPFNEWRPSWSELNTIKTIAETKVRSIKEQERNEFQQWRIHYQCELNEMYNIYVKNNLAMTYDQFIQIAYECSETVFNLKKLKHVRPLD